MISKLESHTFSELSVGDSVCQSRLIVARDALLLAAITGTPPTDAAWAGLLLGAVSGCCLPGSGSSVLRADLQMISPILAGMEVEIRLTVREKLKDNQVLLDCFMRVKNGKLLVEGTLRVRVPTERSSLVCTDAPDVRINDHVRYQQLIARCKDLTPAVTAIVHPCDAMSLRSAVEAGAAGLIIPVLVGPTEKIRRIAAEENLDIAALRVVTAPHSHAAAAEAVALARRGEVEMLMKGSLHTDELMHEVMREETGLRTGRRISHVYVFDVAAYPRPLFITDAAINILPSLADKRDICQNAIDLAHVLGVEKPRVAVLSAVETVTASLPSTLDAAALCKMADRGQITGALIDGPLAFDNAISPQAAHDKAIVSPVAGQADILLVPDLEAGNMLAKQLTFFDGADGAGIVLGARLPIVLTSRADPQRTRIASCAIGLLLVDARRREPLP